MYNLVGQLMKNMLFLAKYAMQIYISLKVKSYDHSGDRKTNRVTIIYTLHIHSMLSIKNIQPIV